MARETDKTLDQIRAELLASFSPADWKSYTQQLLARKASNTPHASREPMPCPESS